MPDVPNPEPPRRTPGAAIERHLRNLAAVEALIRIELAATSGPWQLDRTPGSTAVGLATSARESLMMSAGQGQPVGGLMPIDAVLAAVLRNGAQAALAGRHRLLRRHAPYPGEGWGEQVVCSACVDVLAERAPWPCPDYLDAEAGLAMPHLATVSGIAEVQLVAVECVGCGWTRTFSHARDTEMAQTATRRLAAMWGRRHEQGDPEAQDTLHAVTQCGICSTKIVWKPDARGGLQPGWVHVDQAAAEAHSTGEHRAAP